jgi:hypothetical protein
MVDNTLNKKDMLIQYRESERVNQSLLKELMNNQYLPRKEDGKTLFYEEKKYFLHGDMVDKILLTNDLEDYYYRGELQKKPSEAIMSIVHECKSLGLSLENSLEVARRQNYNKNYKDETLLNKVIEEGAEYYEELENAGFRTVVSQDDYDKAMSIAEKVKGSNFAYLVQDTEICQIPLEFEIDGVLCKALLDILFTENGYKNVVDLKTGYDYAFNFRTSARSHRYDIQGMFYKEAVLQNFENVLPTQFLVVSTEKDDIPLLYTMTERDEKIAWYGNRENNRHVYGIKEAIATYKDMMEMDPAICTNVEAFKSNYNLNLNLYV